jgi:N-carbamoyl-L-amino-acid hydrolase
VPGAVATVGTIGVEPGGTNVVPGRAFGTIDARAMTNADRDAVIDAIARACPSAEIAATTTDDGAVFDADLRAELFEAASALGVSAMDLPSYAGHDAGTLALAGVPSVMVFTRSPNGISHNPAEHSDEAVCLDAVAVLAAAMAQRLEG